uniref:Uncharacterized protein n=1 Tax=Vitis vinifera TaxID=29760 RepID=A5AH49_VITVI|nr:hypothetical protein VITISV_005322 [Vitis vinifera]
MGIVDDNGYEDVRGLDYGVGNEHGMGRIWPCKGGSDEDERGHRIETVGISGLMGHWVVKRIAGHHVFGWKKSAPHVMLIKTWCNLQTGSSSFSAGEQKQACPGAPINKKQSDKERKQNMEI